MRDILERVSTGAARRILDSANPREVKGWAHCSENERAQVPQWKLREPVCKNIWKRQYASSPRKDESGYERKEERDYKGLRRAQVALPVWQARQPCRSPVETSVRGPIVA